MRPLTRRASSRGAWIVVGGPQAQAVAQVVSIESLPQGDLVHVRPLPGPVSDYGHLLVRHEG
jgi:hypothetical protein